MNHKASREAYAREHGLSALFMLSNVNRRRMMVETHRWEAAFNKLPFKLPTGFIAVVDDWHLTPEEAVAVDKAFQNKNKPTFTVMEPLIFRSVFVGDNRANVMHNTNYCLRCGSKLYDGSCGHCCGDPDCEDCV